MVYDPYMIVETEDRMKMALWSGSEITSEYASMQGYITLETMPWYQLTKGLKLNSDWTKVMPIWKGLSHRYAAQICWDPGMKKQMTGCKCNVFLGGYRPTSVFDVTERPVLSGGETARTHPKVPARSVPIDFVPLVCMKGGGTIKTHQGCPDKCVCTNKDDVRPVTAAGTLLSAADWKHAILIDLDSVNPTIETAIQKNNGFLAAGTSCKGSWQICRHFLQTNATVAARESTEESTEEVINEAAREFLFTANHQDVDLENVVFLPVGAEQNHRASAPELEKRAIAQLSEAAKGQKSLAHSALVTQLAKDPASRASRARIFRR
jgi:hypothetical protein